MEMQELTDKMLSKQSKDNYFYDDGSPIVRDKKTQTFIDKAVNVHGNKYLYPWFMEYKNCETRLPIYCNIHGIFMQTPHDHLSKCGCNKCNKNHKKTFEEVVVIANKIHNNKYKYFPDGYINNESLINIECPIHGIFKQKLKNHLSGCGCYKCARERIEDSRKITQEEYIKRCQDIHNNKYILDNIVYKGIYNYVTPICPLHGKFTISAVNFMNGQGCRKCANKTISTKKMKTQEKTIEEF